MSEHYTFTNPREAARKVRELMAHGATPAKGSRQAMAALGVEQPHTDKRTAEQTAKAWADQSDEEGEGTVDITYAPTPSINPPDPRTAAAGYDPLTQRLRVEWGDMGVAYNYYDVPPQIWAGFKNADSPGRYINAVLNGYRYGPAE